MGEDGNLSLSVLSRIQVSKLSSKGPCVHRNGICRSPILILRAIQWFKQAEGSEQLDHLEWHSYCHYWRRALALEICCQLSPGNNSSLVCQAGFCKYSAVVQTIWSLSDHTLFYLTGNTLSEWVQVLIQEEKVTHSSIIVAYS